MAMERLDLRLDREQMRKLQELSADMGISVFQVVRQLIDDARAQSIGAAKEAAKKEDRPGGRGPTARPVDEHQAEARWLRQVEGTYDPGDLPPAR